MKKEEMPTVTVEEIHETFYTEVDRLLEYAKVSSPIEKPNQALSDKVNRLRKLGFEQAGEIKKMSEESVRIQNKQREKGMKAELIQVITYFSMKYPQYKFITEESVKKICEKYNLVYGETKRYRGTVPDKNLEQIENFKIKKEDECYVSTEGWGSLFYGSEEECRRKVKPRDPREGSFIGGIDPIDTWGSRPFREMDYQWQLMRTLYDTPRAFVSSGNNYQKCSFEICAPVKDFDMSGMTISDHQLKAVTPPDPIVLAPVVYKNKKYYLIVSAWGDEESDENVVNEKMN